jgi:transcriptional repressor NF-X1
VPLRQLPRGMVFGNKGGFAVLSLSSKKKKEKPAEVVEDWEAAEEQEEEKEEKEKGVSDGNSAVVSENENEDAGGMSSRPRSVVMEGEADEAIIPTTPGTARWADMDDE